MIMISKSIKQKSILQILKVILFTILGFISLLAFTLVLIYISEVKRIEKDYFLSPSNNAKIRQLIHSSNPITLYSTGGLTAYPLEIANVIHDQNIEIIVDRECTSACSEFILPAAYKVTFKNLPLIGFHTNILADEYYIKKMATENIDNCNWARGRKIEAQYRWNGINAEFWKEQVKRMKPKVNIDYDLHPCPSVSYEFENRMWYPTSDQIRNLYGLKFSGKVCADEPKCFKRKIALREFLGERIVIGDDVYVSRWPFGMKHLGPY